MRQMAQEEIHILLIQMVEPVLIIKKVIKLIFKITYFFVIKKEVLSIPLKWISSEIRKYQVLKHIIIGPLRKQLFLIVKFLKVKNVQLINCLREQINAEILLVYK